MKMVPVMNVTPITASYHVQVFEILFSIKEILIAVAAYFNCKHTESQIEKRIAFKSICSDGKANEEKEII